MTIHLVSAWHSIDYAHTRLFNVGNYCYELQDANGEVIFEWNNYSYEQVRSDMLDMGYNQKW